MGVYNNINVNISNENNNNNNNILNINPTKIVCIGLNYKDHAKELNMELPKEPVIFLKPTSSIIYNNDTIILPKQSNRVDYEVELAIVIKEKCKNIKKEQALNYVKGYTILNDITARDLQEKDGQWTRAKSFDTFCPIGPKIVDNINPNNLNIKLYVNNKLKQNSNTNNMIFTVEKIIEYISSIMTLYPDDIITTGTPPNIGPLKSKDIVKCEIEHIGTLINYVK